MSADPITILVCALGGEGGGVLAEWLYETAVHAGHSAQSTSIPGVAQRTGATTYYIEVCPQPDSALAGRRPVFSLNPVPGAIDLLVSSKLLATVQRHARGAELLDLETLARESGTVISAVLFGAIAASGVLPFPRAAFEDAIRRGGKGVASSLRGFAAAFDAITARRAQRAQVEALIVPAPAKPAAPAVPEPVRQRLPEAVHEIVALGYARLVEYQDARYADSYLDRLETVATAERNAPGPHRHDGELTRETARWLALWMAFDDIIRVAALKVRAARMERVRREVRAGAGEIVKVYDHFKPGIPEVAGMLPEPIARRLKAWDARRARPWAMPLKLGSHTVHGTVVLRVLAAFKRLRRHGSRFPVEQALIEQWLGALRRGAAESWTLGCEIAKCGRLIKGYGSTNERGKERLLHIVEHLAAAPGMDAAQRAEAIRAVREAALADDTTLAYDAALAAHGAPPRALRAQPIRFHRRRPGTTAPGVTSRH